MPKKNKFKIFIIFLGCLFFRLLPFRAPNLEPIMASIMPLSKKYGVLMAFLFGFLSIFIFDLLTFFGSWTWLVAITYGLVGIGANFYFQKYKTSVLNFAVFAFMSTILFDLITGVLFAPIFNQTILNALMLQIPFTLLHLAGNVGLAITLSPILNIWLNKEKSFKFSSSVLTLKKLQVK